MRTASIRVDGVEYPLCFSALVVRDATDFFGGISEMYDAMDDANQARRLDATIRVVSMMMSGGAAYAQVRGLPHPDPLSYEALYATCTLGDLAALRGAVVETVNRGSAVHVEAEPEKNGAATQGGA